MNSLPRLGNDLVWLADPDNVGRAGDERLLRRVLTPAERLLVRISTDPDRMLWSLWAAKEAAYKAFCRESGETRFSPAAFEVIPEPAKNAAMVRHGGWAIPVRWTQAPDHVHAVAASGPTAAAVEVRPRGEAESGHVRALAVRLALREGWGPGRIEDRPPVFRPETGPDRPVSLSHDGPYSAVVFLRP